MLRVGAFFDVWLLDDAEKKEKSVTEFSGLQDHVFVPLRIVFCRLFIFPRFPPQIKSFRKGDGGAGEEGKHFFKMVYLFPRIIISPYFFFDTTMAARRES